MERIYLDNCCLNRPLNDQSIPRIRLEAEAIKLIYERIDTGELEWVASTVLDEEIDATPDLTVRRELRASLRAASECVQVTPELISRASELHGMGFGTYDALHLSCAESAEVDSFFTVDDRLLRRAKRLSSELKIRVVNPLAWIQEVGP